MADPSSSTDKPSNGAKEDIAPEILTELKELEVEIENVDKIIAREYTKLMRPVYERRRDIFRKISGFWPKTLKKHEIIESYLQDEDGEVVQHLTDVFVEKDDDIVEKYNITLSFSENPYIKSKEVVKEFFLGDQGQICTKCANIEWHEGKDFSKKRKSSNADDLSLFRWLVSDNVVEPHGYDLGKIIADDVYPNAQQYFQNDDDYDEVVDESDLELGDDDDEDEEDEEDRGAPPSKRTRES